jgi:hypothetical protein
MNYEIHPRSGRVRLGKNGLPMSAAVRQRGTWRQTPLAAENSTPPSTVLARAAHGLATGFPRPSQSRAAGAIAACDASFVVSTGCYRQEGPPHSYYH